MTIDLFESVTECGCATFRSAQPVPVIWLEEADRPGVLDDFLQPLAAAEINLHAVQASARGGSGRTASRATRPAALPVGSRRAESQRQIPLQRERR